MKTSLRILIILPFVCLSVIGFAYFSNDFNIENAEYGDFSFKPGEEILYNVHVAFISAANAKMVVMDDIQDVNGKPCYKMEIYGNSKGMFDLFMHVDDTWGTYFDTSSLVPHKSYRKLTEGNFKKHEIVTYNYLDNKAVVESYSFKRGYWVEQEEFKIPDNVLDLVSGYYYLRLLDFDTLKVDDIITMDTFFEDSTYNFQITYLGNDEINTKLGKKNSFVFSPIMPDNSIFDGKNAIKFWLSDDPFKVPLKIKASLFFFGSLEADIVGFTPGKTE